MAPLEIKLWPYPSLLTACKTVTKVDKQLLDWIGEMQELVVSHNGLGLAANQVGLPYRLYVTAKEAFINPVIKHLAGGISVLGEGCLSLPGISLDVPRSKKVTIHAFTETGDEIRATLSGIDARVAQHECDHLDGLSFFSRAPEDVLKKSGVITLLDKVQAVFMDDCEKGEIDLAAIQNELRELMLARTDWKEPQMADA
jgi:peptide deformylase